MCGIWALIGELMEKRDIEKYVSLLKNRGPEGEKIFNGPNYQLGFTRLALNGLNEAGMQPMCDQGVRWICNGEIYNWKELANEIGFTNKSGSDCAIIGPLFKNVIGLGGFFRSLHGVFAMVIVDMNNNIIVARDPYGVRPLFISKTDSRIVIASEVKAIPTSENVIPFPPGHYATINPATLEIVYYKYHTFDTIDIPVSNVFDSLRYALINAVKRRMLTERPIAALLSGGLDSSLIAALVQQELKKSKRCLETYSIGFYGSEDLKHARMVAQHIGSTHTEIVMTPDQFFDAIPKVIVDIESYDITTVRASVGNWLVAKEIAKLSQCKVVFNGDGSDEVLGGYLYFYKAPNDHEFEKESNRLLEDIHLFDVLRSDRCISSHGLEPRTPFLDKDFVKIVKSIPIEMRRPSATQIEKWVLREAFKGDLLPKEVLYRKKEAFSDGVSTSGGLFWYQECQYKALKMFPNWKQDSKYIVHLEPQSAEAYYYRMLFDAYYPKTEKVIPYFWMPKWSPETSDPSAKTLT